MKEKYYLVTGGAGYIGSHMVKLLLEKKCNVVVIDNLSRGYKDAIKKLSNLGNLKFEKADLTNKKQLEKVFQKYNIETVLHFAALCLVDESMKKPEKYFYNNVFGSLNLLEAMRDHGINKIVFSSTCAVYGQAKYLPVDEKHSLNPMNPYGLSKKMVEEMIEWYGSIYNFNYVIFRYFNVCGAGKDGFIGDSKKPSQLLVQNAVRGALNIEKFHLTCPKVDTQDGTPIRDYIDVNDLAGAHYLATEVLKKNDIKEIINLGTGKGYSVLEIVSEVEKITGKKIEYSLAKETRQGEYPCVYADNKKALEILKWKPEMKLEDSVGNLLKWYKNYPNGYKK